MIKILKHVKYKGFEIISKKTLRPQNIMKDDFLPITGLIMKDGKIIVDFAKGRGFYFTKEDFIKDAKEQIDYF